MIFDLLRIFLGWILVKEVMMLSFFFEMIEREELRKEALGEGFDILGLVVKLYIIYIYGENG